MVGISATMPVETAEHDLKGVLERLHLGETLTLVSSEGAPLAVVVSLKPAPVESETASDWWARWDELTRKISRAWKGKQSAGEILAEMRR